MSIISGNLLERVCNKTEFEVEGWRKIPPLMEILENNIPAEVIKKMRLETIQIPQVIPKDKYDSARTTNDVTKLNVRTIRQSSIYNHFKNADTKDTKIAIYVNAIVPINQNLECIKQIYDVGNHCVVVKGLTQWTENNQNVECLELENNGGCEQTRFIPVDHPFFEEIQIVVGKIYRDYQGSDDRNRHLNRYGRKLVNIKWGEKKVENKWYEVKKELKPEIQENTDKEKLPYKYEMLFVRGLSPCFQLKFHS